MKRSERKQPKHEVVVKAGHHEFLVTLQGQREGNTITTGNGIRWVTS